VDLNIAKLETYFLVLEVIELNDKKKLESQTAGQENSKPAPDALQRARALKKRIQAHEQFLKSRPEVSIDR